MQRRCQSGRRRGSAVKVGRLAMLLAVLLAPGLPVAPALASTSPSPSFSPTLSPTPQPSPKAQPSVQTPDPKAQQQLIADITSAEASALAAQRVLASSQLGLLALGQQVLDADRTLAGLDERIGAISVRHAAVAARLQEDRQGLASLTRRLYKSQRGFLAALIGSNGFGGLLRSLAYGQSTLSRETTLLKQVQSEERTLADTQADLARTRAEQQVVRERLQAARTELAGQVEQQQRLLSDLRHAIDDALTALQAIQTDSPMVAQERARLIRIRTEALVDQIKQSAWMATAQPGVSLPSLDAVLKASGRVLWPIPQATITQPFGPSPFSFEPAYAGFSHFHTGIDLAVSLGTPVMASADGLVLGAHPMTDGTGNLVGYGNFVIIQHDGMLKTLYGHLLTILVKEGQTVQRGQLIGLVGSTGNSTGAHTHFEVRIDNTPVDPTNLLSAKN